MRNASAHNWRPHPKGVVFLEARPRLMSNIRVIHCGLIEAVFTIDLILHTVQNKLQTTVLSPCNSLPIVVGMPRCACTVCVCVCVCLCVCLGCYSCSGINEVQVRVSIGF